MNDEQFLTIINKLDLIQKALVLNLINDREFKDQVIFLNRIGFAESDIVKLLNSNRAKVHSILWRAK